MIKATIQNYPYFTEIRLETSIRPNINGVINTAQSAMHLRQMVTAVAKK